MCVRDLCVCVYSPHCLSIGPQFYPVIYVVANPVRGLLDRKRSEEHLQSSNEKSVKTKQKRQKERNNNTKHMPIKDRIAIDILSLKDTR